MSILDQILKNDVPFNDPDANRRAYGGANPPVRTIPQIQLSSNDNLLQVVGVFIFGLLVIKFVLK